MGQTFLLTGEPRVGKTTTVKKVLDSLDNVRCCGFYTQEIRVNGEREGFNIITLSGQTGIMARKSLKGQTDLHVSSYGVSLDFLENVALPAMGEDLEKSELVVIDEIGPMQILSSKFRTFVLDLLTSSKIIFGTIYMKNYEWLDDIKRLANVRLFQITPDNRDSMAKELEKIIKGHLYH